MLRWVIFCRVIDNHGDLGVCWRLSRALAALGDRVCLRVDDARALKWMAPTPVRGIDVLPFDSPPDASPMGDVVVEAFGCDLPSEHAQRMRKAARPPVWINFEYLSAEPYVERSHGLESPQMAGAGAGLVKWFYYPGFSPRTGGLLRATPSTTTLQAEPPRREGERVVSVFAYAHADFEGLLRALAREPTVILASPGPSMHALQALFVDGVSTAHPLLRLHPQPWMPQTSFDDWLTRCDLNVVRGEDSLVSALWAGKPFIWNAYWQDDHAHAAKVDALLDAMLEGATPALAAPIRHLWHRFNGLGRSRSNTPTIESRLLDAWTLALHAWRTKLQLQPDLAAQLRHFALTHRDPTAPGRTGPPG